MEAHKAERPTDTYGLTLAMTPERYFKTAQRFVQDHYRSDYQRIANTRFSEVSAEQFFTEYCWVVCTSGFNATVVSRFFPRLMEALSPLVPFLTNQNVDPGFESVRLMASTVFGNKRKVHAMVETAKQIHFGSCGEAPQQRSWRWFRDSTYDIPEKLQQLPYIGAITCQHLARNIGLLDSVKPDLHLTRAATRWGFDSPLDLCRAIQETNPDIPLGLIDYVLFMGLSTWGSK